jgi:hypothetical protein
MVDRNQVLGGTVVRVPKAYPAYFGRYREFGKVHDYLSRFANLYPIGRNGMHRYNNRDHSMLAAKSAASSMISGGVGKREIWHINSEDSCHEEIGGHLNRDSGHVIKVVLHAPWFRINCRHGLPRNLM